MSEVMTSRIGRFEILESLGDSVAGNHYRAFDPATNREVAVETFRLGTLPSDAAREAFVTGLKRSAHLLHPKIAAVFDVGVDNDLAYVAGEQLTGTTLERAMVESGPYELGQIAPVLRQIGAALDHAHAQGVVHGGLEPSRVLILENGDVKVTGFGSDFPAVRTAQGAHAFAGEPKYFSPERVRGEALTHRADIFSFGAIVYELLTGQGPFDSDSLITELYRLVNEPHRPATELRASLPAAIDEALDYALAKQPKDRYLSCATFIDSLDAIIPAAAEPSAIPVAEAAQSGSAETIQYCDQCGSELQAKMKFCWSCGTTVIHESGTPAVGDVSATGVAEVAPSEANAAAERNVVKIEAVPIPVPVPVQSTPVAVPTGKAPEKTPETEPVKAAEAPVAPAAVAGSASTSKLNAVSSRATVPMEAVVDEIAEIGKAVDVKKPARTEVARTEVAPAKVARTEVATAEAARTETAHAVGILPPPLSGYAMSTGTKSLPAPGVEIDAAPSKPSTFRATLPILIFVVILLVFGALGFWFAPRFLAPKASAPPPAVESAPSEATPAVPAESSPGSTEAPPTAPETPTAASGQ
ncbi:MAG: protein kinase [Blastocatellia bacterium]|nr:protein kinase [Blastocatellia bacterium]